MSGLVSFGGFICIAPIMIPKIFNAAQLTVGNDPALGAFPPPMVALIMTPPLFDFIYGIFYGHFVYQTIFDGGVYPNNMGSMELVSANSM